VHVTVTTPCGTSPASGKGAKHAKFEYQKGQVSLLRMSLVAVLAVRKFPVPGHTAVEGAATGKLNRRESFSTGEPCPKSLSASFVITLLGGNNNPLEPELAAARGAQS
jgi:hypothetical protein